MVVLIIYQPLWFSLSQWQGQQQPEEDGLRSKTGLYLLHGRWSSPSFRTGCCEVSWPLWFPCVQSASMSVPPVVLIVICIFRIDQKLVMVSLLNVLYPCSTNVSVCSSLDNVVSFES